MPSRLLPLLLAPAIAVSAQPAAAADVARIETITAVNLCQPALPAFDGAFRKRPRAIANEGDASAFLSCGLLARAGTQARHDAVEVVFLNRGPTGATVNCTLVDSTTLSAANPDRVLTKTVSVGVFAFGSIVWASADINGARYLKPAVSCSVPPQVDVLHVSDLYLEDVGA